MKKFRHLNVPSHWEHYWSKYPEGYTILEALLNWVRQVDDMVDNVNDWNEYLENFVETFDEKLRPHVRDFMQELVENGKLAEIINEEIFAMKVNRDELDNIATTGNFFGADSAADDNTDAINLGLLFAKEQNTQFALNDRHKIQGNIPDIHDVETIGVGSIQRGSDVWYLNPVDGQTNRIYVSDLYDDAEHDGLTKDSAVSMQKAIDIIKALGYKAGNGHWVIKIIGTIKQPGFTMRAMPLFKNRLIIEGERDEYGNILSIIDGADAAQAYWFRADMHSSTKFYEFRNLRFINWNTKVNNGALVVWEDIDVYLHDCEFKNCDRAIWGRSGRLQIDDNIFEDMRSAVSMQYHAHFNVSRNAFINCLSSGCHMGRNSAGHFQENYYRGCYMDIDATQSSRLRTISNTHEEWELCALNVGLNTTYERVAGQEEIIVPGSLTQATPFLRLYYGGTDPRLTRGTHVGVHSVNMPNSLTTFREVGEFNLSTSVGTLLRLPNYFLLMTGGHINIKLIGSFGVGAEFDLVFTGGGVPDSTSEIFRVPIRNNGTAGTNGAINIDIYSARQGSTIGYLTYDYPHPDGRKSGYMSANYGNAATGASLDQEVTLHRIYVVNKTTNSFTLAGGMSTVGFQGV